LKCEDCPHAIRCYGDKLTGDHRKFSYCPVCRKCVIYARKMLTPSEIASKAFMNPNFMTTNGAAESSEQYGAVWAEGEYIDCELRHELTLVFLKAFGGPAFRPDKIPKVWSKEVLEGFKTVTLESRDPGPGSKPIHLKMCDICYGRVDTINMNVDIALQVPLEYVDVALKCPKGVSARSWEEACNTIMRELAKQLEEDA